MTGSSNSSNILPDILPPESNWVEELKGKNGGIPQVLNRLSLELPTGDNYYHALPLREQFNKDMYGLASKGDILTIPESAAEAKKRFGTFKSNAESYLKGGHSRHGKLPVEFPQVVENMLNNMGKILDKALSLAR